MNYKFQFLCCFLFATLTINACQGAVVEHGENCTDIDFCNQEHWLNCSSAGKCECETDTYWDSSGSLCRAAIGSSCAEPPSSPIRSCIINANCWKESVNEPGICRCEEGYISTPSNQQCLRGHRQSCGSDSDCNKYSFLRCRDNLCVCDEENKNWNPILEKCVCKFGKFCGAANQTCVDNSVLDPTMKICVCSEYYQETPEGECKLKYQQPCDTSIKCHPKFKCLEYNSSSTAKVCRCDPNTEEYDEGLDLCRIKAGKSCESNTNCVKHSYCSEISKLCQCSAEYEESINGHCVAGHGTYCRNEENICNLNLNLECNKQTWKCDCINGYHNYDTIKCSALPGTSCSVDADCYEFSECVNNTESIPAKICACKNGFTKTPENTCALDHGQKCNMDSACNQYNFLSCDIKTQLCNCSHSSEMTYNELSKSCQSKASQVCYTEEIEKRKLECVPNADCVRDASNPIQFIGNCECVNGFYPNENGFCDTTAPAKGSILVKSSSLFIVGFLFSTLRTALRIC